MPYDQRHNIPYIPTLFKEMINTSEVIGSLSTRRLVEALQKALPSLRIIEGNMLDDKKPLRNELFVRQIDTSVSEATGTDEVQQLQVSLKRADEIIASLQKEYADTKKSLEALKKKFDNQSAQLSNILWNHCVPFHPSLINIPAIEDPKEFVETDKRIGNYTLGEFFGQGQFATIRLCHKDGETTDRALKILRKDSITSIAAANRVALEIEALKRVILSIFSFNRSACEYYILLFVLVA
jgi:hypothetical protein